MWVRAIKGGDARSRKAGVPDIRLDKAVRFVATAAGGSEAHAHFVGRNLFSDPHRQIASLAVDNSASDTDKLVAVTLRPVDKGNNSGRLSAPHHGHIDHLLQHIEGCSFPEAGVVPCRVQKDQPKVSTKKCKDVAFSVGIPLSDTKEGNNSQAK